MSVHTPETSFDEAGLPILTESEIMNIFSYFDTDNSGDITIEEFELGVNKLRLPVSQSDIEEIIAIADMNNDGCISYSEFKSFVLAQDEKLRHTFSKLDINSTHEITANDIRFLIDKELHLQLTNDEIFYFIHYFDIKKHINDNMSAIDIDIDSDHRISFEHFREKLLLLPKMNVRYIFDNNRPFFSIDIGEDLRIPNDDITSDSIFHTTHNLSTDEEKQSKIIEKMLKQQKQNYSKSNIFLAGGMAGAISRSITAPADRLKVLFQSGILSNKTSLISIVRQIYREGGLISFWRGNGANVIKIAPESAFKFAAYDVIKKFVCEHNDCPRIHERFISGAMAGAFSQTLIYPLEIAKTRLALASTGEYNGIAHCLGNIIKKDGYLAIYRGCFTSVMGIIPYAGVDLAIYNTIKDQISRYRMQQQIHIHIKENSTVYHHQHIQISSWEVLLAGSVSSICGQMVAYPFQVCRTKLQSGGQSVSIRMSDGSTKLATGEIYHGFRDVMTRTFQMDGIPGFYRGISVNFMKSVPAIAISYVVFEKCKQLFSPII